MFVLPLKPLAKPRMTRRDQRQAEKYWVYKDEINLHCNLLGYVPGNEIKLGFHLPMPKSWRKSLKNEMEGQPHQSRPDLDNLVKAFLDALLSEDKSVWRVDASKRWAREGRIEVCNLEGEREIVAPGLSRG